jgi:hypothetical protein
LRQRAIARAASERSFKRSCGRHGSWNGMMIVYPQGQILLHREATVPTVAAVPFASKGHSPAQVRRHTGTCTPRANSDNADTFASSENPEKK